jgi:hypothetical protein
MRISCLPRILQFFLHIGRLPGPWFSIPQVIMIWRYCFPLFSTPLQFHQGQGKGKEDNCLVLSLESPGVQQESMVLASLNLHCFQQGKSARQRERQKGNRRPCYSLKLLTFHWTLLLLKV